MSKRDEGTQTIQREVGEHVSFGAHFEPEKTKDLGEGVIEATVSTNTVDHHGEIINQDGVDTSQYHGTVLYGHDYQALPIGKTISLKKTKSKITAKFQMAVNEYPFAKTVYDLIKGGYLTDVSIGGIVSKWSDDYRTIEEMVMKEFSVVPIGANSNAMITGKAFETIGKTPAVIQSEYEDFNRKVLLDKVSGMGEHELKDAIRVLHTLVARLEETASAPSPADDKPTKRTRRLILADARAVATQSQTVIKTVKLSIR